MRHKVQPKNSLPLDDFYNPERNARLREILEAAGYQGIEPVATSYGALFTKSESDQIIIIASGHTVEGRAGGRQVTFTHLGNITSRQITKSLEVKLQQGGGAIKWRGGIVAINPFGECGSVVAYPHGGRNWGYWHWLENVSQDPIAVRRKTYPLPKPKKPASKEPEF